MLNDMVNNLILSLDPAEFAQVSLRFEADEIQARALRSGSRKIILNCCRQFGKTSVASLLALHLAWFVPKSLIIIISYIKDQAAEAYRKIETFQSIMEDRPPDIEHSKVSMAFANRSRILILSGKEGSVRGYSPSLIIVDEASRVPDETYFSLRPALAVSGGSLMLVSTPKGRRGFFYHEWKSGEEWERYEVTAWQCPRISDEWLRAEREKIGPLWFGQEYECKFIETSNYMFDPELFKLSVSSEVKPIRRESVVSSDIKPIEYEGVLK